MDGNEFDQLLRKLGATATRRKALGGLAAGLASAAGVAGVAEAKNKGQHAAGKQKKKGVGKQQVCGGIGCVNQFNDCRAGNDYFECGHSGNACADCTDAGVTAVCAPVPGGGTCTNSLNCRVGTCQTGASGTQTCVARGSTTSCGQELFNTNNGVSGNVCNPPCAAGQSCPSNADNETCSGSTCASFCATGCCTNFGGNTVCAAGTEDFACGNNGGQCIDCGSGTCNRQPGGGGICSNAACSSANCAGCCTAGGVCAGGNSNGQCGLNGASCAACGTGQQCTGGSCVNIPPPPCGPGTCAGCCSGTTCVNPPTDAACGTGGAACVACSGKKGTCRTGKHGKPLACRK